MSTNDSRVRPTILFIGLFIATMLIQTGSSSLGTYLTLFIVLAIISYGLVGRHFTLIRSSALLAVVLFAVTVTMNMLLRGYVATNYLRLIAQVLTYCVVLSFDIPSEKEIRFLKNTFLYSSLIYGCLIIYVCINTTRNIHSHITLFGTRFDPNYLGMPFVIAMAIIMYELLFDKAIRHKVLHFIIYLVCVITIMMTASRGVFLAWVTTSLSIFTFFIFSRNMSFTRKIVLCIVTVFAVIVLYNFVSSEFPTVMNRLLSIGDEGSDNGRLLLWARSLSLWKDNPIFGAGLQGNYRAFGGVSHNTYVQILSETGLFGLAIWAYLYGRLFIRTFRQYRCGFFILIGLFIQMFFLDALDNRVVWAVLFWLTVVTSRNGNLPSYDYEE